MHEVWRALVFSQIRVEQLSSLRQEVAMRQAIVVPGKHGIEDLMLALKEAEIKVEDIPVHMHQGDTVTQQMKYINETPIVIVHVGKIKETTTYLCPPRKSGGNIYQKIMI